MMRIGIPKERLANEARVAATPKTVEQLLKLGFTVAIESGAGINWRVLMMPIMKLLERLSPTPAMFGSQI